MTSGSRHHYACFRNCDGSPARMTQAFNVPPFPAISINTGRKFAKPSIPHPSNGAAKGIRTKVATVSVSGVREAAMPLTVPTLKGEMSGKADIVQN
jgi:hypothetical protein